MDSDGSGDVDKDEGRDVEVEPEIEITVLAKGDTFVYTVPSFPVYKPTLQQMKLQCSAIYWISLCPQLRR